MKTPNQESLFPEMEKRRDVYEELIDRVGHEETLIFLVLSEYVVRHTLAELKATSTVSEYKGKDFLTIRIDKKTSHRVIIDEEIKEI